MHKLPFVNIFSFISVFAQVQSFHKFTLNLSDCLCLTGLLHMTKVKIHVEHLQGQDN